MTIKKWIYIFWTTLVLGTVVSVAMGALLLALFDDISLAEGTKAGYDGYTITFVVLIGATISVLSQMGFFSYLIIRYIAIGIFRSKRLWEYVQLFLIADTVFAMIYLPYASFAGPGESIASYLAIPLALLAAALLISYWKVKQTNRNAFVPTLFFMYTVTALEAVIALRQNSLPLDLYMLAVLVVCNGWQIMLLHKLVGNAGGEKQEPRGEGTASGQAVLKPQLAGAGAPGGAARNERPAGSGGARGQKPKSGKKKTPSRSR